MKHQFGIINIYKYLQTLIKHFTLDGHGAQERIGGPGVKCLAEERRADDKMAIF